MERLKRGLRVLAAVATLAVLAGLAPVTREVEALDYEAYAEMAEARIQAIVEEEIARHGLCKAAVLHRVGRVPLSEPSVLVAASAPHRGEAFAGAQPPSTPL